MQRWVPAFILYVRLLQTHAEVANTNCCSGRATFVNWEPDSIRSYSSATVPLAQRIVGIVHREMDTIGKEFHLPALNPREVWESSGR